MPIPVFSSVQWNVEKNMVEAWKLIVKMDIHSLPEQLYGGQMVVEDAKFVAMHTQENGEKRNVLKKLKIEGCACKCGMTTLAIDAVYDDDDEPYISLTHMTEAQQNQYIERYADGE